MLFLVLCSLVTIYLLVDLFERIDDFLAAKKPISLVIKYLFLKIPLMFDQLIPVCILLAGVITLGLLNRNNEFLALNAGGICVSRIVRPLIFSSLLFTLITMAMGQWVLPSTLTATNKIWYEDIRDIAPKGIYHDGYGYYKGLDGIYSFTRINPKSSKFRDFAYCMFDRNYRLSLLINAETAEWKDGTWFFENGLTKKQTATDDYTITSFEQLSLDLPESPEDFFLPDYKKGEMSLTQLYEKAQLNALHDDQLAWSDFHQRLSYIFLGFPLIFLGIPVLLAFQQKKGRDLALAIPASCGLAFAAWGWWSAAQSLVKATYLSPMIASWSLHIIACILGLVMIKRKDI
ncbi:MAG: LptF/LptG family permease [Proteobacteria bacterium]|nr:LptF/LptG family permease [Pseudomonadota bacterium]MBU1715449.1 LptF/LptG family permease [Pseudomonadota bacterium]